MDDTTLPAAPDAASTLARLGLDPVAERVYLAMLEGHDGGVRALGESVGLTPEAVHEALGRLRDVQLCAVVDDRFEVSPPHVAIDAMILRREQELLSAVAELRRSRESVGVLLDSYMHGFRTAVTDDLDRIEGQEAVRALMRRLAEQAQTEVLSVFPRLPDLEGARMGAGADSLALSRGVRLRTVMPSGLRSEPGLWTAALDRVEAGLEMRLHASPPLQCVLVDASVAVVPLEPTSVGDGAWVVRAPGLLQPIRLLMESVWAEGVPVEFDRDHVDQARVHDVFRLLSRGLKDEAVARRLDTSVRTVRRLVAEGMQLLGTDSRFEAGVMAERRGWLD